MNWHVAGLTHWNESRGRADQGNWEREEGTGGHPTMPGASGSLIDAYPLRMSDPRAVDSRHR